MPSNSSSDTLHQLLRRFGHEEFRPGQRECIETLLTGRDVLAVLPTSAGKSLIYQLTSQTLPGVTWGDGQITRVEGDLLTVLFETVGYKTFDASMVEERAILERAESSEVSELERAS